jgi:hypothetical protein
MVETRPRTLSNAEGSWPGEVFGSFSMGSFFDLFTSSDFVAQDIFILSLLCKKLGVPGAGKPAFRECDFAGALPGALLPDIHVTAHVRAEPHDVSLAVQDDRSCRATWRAGKQPTERARSEECFHLQAFLVSPFDVPGTRAELPEEV